MIAALVIRAPSQCKRSISSHPDTPGKRYLLPPEKPTASCGSTGPITRVTSCSTTARLTCTSTAWLSIPPDSSAIRLAGIVPSSTKVAGSHHSWFRPGQPRCAASSGSVIAAWVPSATRTLSRVTLPSTARRTADRSTGNGQLRVPSGTITQRLCPSRSTAPSCSRTKASICSSERTSSAPPIGATG